MIKRVIQSVIQNVIESVIESVIEIYHVWSCQIYHLSILPNLSPFNLAKSITFSLAKSITFDLVKSITTTHKHHTNAVIAYDN